MDVAHTVTAGSFSKRGSDAALLFCAMDKDSLRKSLMEKRRALSPAEWLERSKAVQQRLVQEALFERARSIALYRALPREVSTSEIHEAAVTASKRIGYPEARSPDQPMRFIRAGAGVQWSTGLFGFEVPVSTESLGSGEIEAFVIPGLAFDRAGRRLGRGAGHYDRTLASAPGLRIGLALDFQVLDELPQDPWDVCMDLVVTESEMIRASPRARR